MDKQNLYYIVTKGTNNRSLTTDKCLLICDSDAADREIELWAPYSEKISIADYEATFEEQEVE